jgi:hypothetical protein
MSKKGKERKGIANGTKETGEEKRLGHRGEGGERRDDGQDL